MGYDSRRPNDSLHWYCTSRRCASSPQALSHTSAPSPRPLSSTQLVIHLSRNPPAGGSLLRRSPSAAQRWRGAPRHVFLTNLKRRFPRPQPPPSDATDTHLGSARGLAARPPARAGGAAARHGAPMHCTSCRISSLGYVGEPCLICCNVPNAIGGLRSFLPVLASS